MRVQLLVERAAGPGKAGAQDSSPARVAAALLGAPAFDLGRDQAGVCLPAHLLDHGPKIGLEFGDVARAARAEVRCATQRLMISVSGSAPVERDWLRRSDAAMRGASVWAKASAAPW